MKKLVLNILSVILAMSSAEVFSQVRISPAIAYIEPSANGDQNNFDIIITNPEKITQTISEIEVIYQDKSGKPIWARRLDGNGVVPAITTIPDRELKSGITKMVFNPFPALPIKLHASSVTVRVKLSDADKKILTYEAKTELYKAPHTALTLPLLGKVMVWDGHDLLSHHRRWDYVNPVVEGFGFHQFNALFIRFGAGRRLRKYGKRQ